MGSRAGSSRSEAGVVGGCLAAAFFSPRSEAGVVRGLLGCSLFNPQVGGRCGGGGGLLGCSLFFSP